MKTKTNRRVKRSKKTRRTRRKLRKVKGGGFGIINKGREWLGWRNRRKEAMDKIDNEYWECKLNCEMNHNRKLREVKEQYDNEWARITVQASSRKVHPEPIKAQVPTIVPAKEEYDEVKAAVDKYKRDYRSTYPSDPLDDLPPNGLHSDYVYSPSNNTGKKTDNGWYVDLGSSTIRNIHNKAISLKTIGLQNHYEWYITRLPNPSVKYKSSIPNSPEYTLVQIGTNLAWKNESTGKLIEFSTHRPLLITDNDREILIYPYQSSPAKLESAFNYEKYTKEKPTQNGWYVVKDSTSGPGYGNLNSLEHDNLHNKDDNSKCSLVQLGNSNVTTYLESIENLPDPSDVYIFNYEDGTITELSLKCENNNRLVWVDNKNTFRANYNPEKPERITYNTKEYTLTKKVEP
jgi:hypothetical protein